VWIPRGHRTIQLIVLAGLARDGQFERVEPRGDGLGRAALFQVARFGNLAFAFNPLAIGICGRQGELARQQKVAGVAVGDLDDLAALAQVLDVVSQNDVHDRS
jgi:hypothetical protein